MPIGKVAGKSDFKSVPAGKYLVAFKDFFPMDDDGLPVLSQQSGEKLVIRYHTRVVEGEHEGEEPPGWIEANTSMLTLLVKCFGGDTAKVSLDKEDPGRSLIAVQKMLTNVGKKVEILVNDAGWISALEGMNVPAGSYYVKYEGITSRDASGQISWVEKDGVYGVQKRAFGNFVVTSKNFKGARVPFAVDYPLVVTDTGEIAFVTKKGGVLTKGSARLYNLMKTFGVDPETWDVQPEDKQNILPELDKALREADKIAVVKVTDTGWADLDALSPIPEEEEKETSSAMTYEQALKILYEAIERELMVRGKKAFDDDGNKTEDFKAWAKEYVAPICNAHKFPRGFDRMTAPMLITILEELKLMPVEQKDEDF